MVNADLIFGGVEGGATHSNIVLVDGRGQVLSTADGPATNHWLVGLDECVARIKKLVDDAKAKAGIGTSAVLDGLGLCLSGCEQESSNKKLEMKLQQSCPNLAETIFIGSDTIGSVSTGCQEGVIIIIGTGSNSLLLNPNGATYQSGGWGHMSGDEGSAYWIASRAVKVFYDEEDNLVEPPFSTTVLRQLIFEHFELNDRFDMLPHWYSNFDKQRYASLTLKISKAATNGDQMCIQLMKEAGFHTGRYLSALSRNMDPTMLTKSSGLEVVCSGSVFKSWPLLKAGFLEGIEPKSEKDVQIPKFSLLRLEVTSAFGAVYQAARKHGYDLPRDYKKNSKSLFVYDSESDKVNNLSNGYSNGHSNGHTTEQSNGHNNGETNGHMNGLNNGLNGIWNHTNGRCRHLSGSLLKLDKSKKNAMVTSSLTSLDRLTNNI